MISGYIYLCSTYLKICLTCKALDWEIEGCEGWYNIAVHSIKSTDRLLFSSQCIFCLYLTALTLCCDFFFHTYRQVWPAEAMELFVFFSLLERSLWNQIQTKYLRFAFFR